MKWVDVLSYAGSECNAVSNGRVSSLLCLFCSWFPVTL